MPAPVFIALFVCAVLILSTTLLHYEFLRGLSVILQKIEVSGRARVLMAILGTFIAHILEIMMYGAAYYFLRDKFGLGSFTGQLVHSFPTFVYFSAETYTSVGFGDIVPTGPLRFVCGTEALNGLLLIGWSASFTYVFMTHFWKLGADPK